MNKEKTFGRRKIGLLLLLLIIAAISVLLYFEQVAVIYVLANLGLIILLFTVAFADLENVGRDNSPEGSDKSSVSPKQND